MQLKDVDVKCRQDVGETILRLFLGIPNSRLTSIIRLKPRAGKNIAYHQASHTAAKLKDRRLTQQACATSLINLSSSTASKVRAPRQCGKGRSRGRKTKVKKEGLQVINKCKRKGYLKSP